MKIATAPTGILGTGSYPPDRLVSNEEIARPAALDPQELAVIVVATSTSDQPQPATAGFVQDLIGARGAAALVIGADLYSRCLDYSDRKTAIQLGDGAGAAVLGPVPRGRGLFATRLQTFGEYHNLIRVEAGGSWLPASDRTVREGRHHFRMEGRAIREFVSGNVPKLVHGMLDDCGLRSDEIRHFVAARVVTSCGAGRVRRPVPNKSRSPEPASRAL